MNYNTKQIVYIRSNDEAPKGFPYKVGILAQDHDIINTISIAKDDVRMIESNCSDGLCLRMRITSSLTAPIICLPNEIFVMLVSDDYKITTG